MLIKPTLEQLSIKGKEEELKIEPSEKHIKPVQVEMFSGVKTGDLVEQLATKSQVVHDMISQLRKQVAEEEKQFAEKDELIVKYQQMYEGLQKSKHG